MEVFLDLADGLPRRSIAAGETLLSEGDVSVALFILLDGALRVEKDGVPITAIVRPPCSMAVI